MNTTNQDDSFLNNPTWYKDAVIYQVHVKCFYDSNNDGVGDFKGLLSKLKYIADLGVNVIWLLPFYPSPMRDDGYDIAEYRDVHPAYGTMDDARRFIAEAHKYGLRIITEMVINHTSDQHHWFQEARLAEKGSRKRNFYVWSDNNQKYEGTRIIFSDTESSNWTWDPVAGQYFWHRFYSNQPDLNFDNPEVLEEVLSIMRFWFDIGVDGLRLDAIPYLVEREGTSNENLPETHEVLKKIRAELDAHYPDRMLLAEANLWPEDIQQYFGNGDECHMAFHFPLMPRMYMAIAQEDRFPIVDILHQMPEIPERCQWAIFLRNHDELTLEMVTDQERDYLWNHYAADKRARINLGIRRRLAPLVERDRRRIELLNSLLLSMPGTPTLYYGDEIGMGDNIFLGDRHGVRTPMQWSDDRNGGFSRADPASLIAPVIMDPLYGFQSVNVEVQAQDTHSLLNWTRRMLSVRKQQKAFGRGTLKILAPANRRILAYLREYTSPEGVSEIILCVANMSRAAQATELDLSSYSGKIPVEMIGGTSFPPVTKLNYLLTLPPYGFYWFLLADDAHMPAWHVPPIERMPELTTLIVRTGIAELLLPPLHTTVQTQFLPVYLQQCPWIAHPHEPIKEISITHAITLSTANETFILLDIAVHRDPIEHYFLPIGFVVEHLAGTASQHLALARLRQKRVVGLLTDAFTLPEFNRLIIRNLREQVVQPFDGGKLHFIANPLLANFEEKSGIEMDFAATKDANGAVVIGETMLLKPVRTIIAGIHPEIEINLYLSECSFVNIVPVLGEVKRIDDSGDQYTLMVLYAHISNQGDAWQWIQNTFERVLRDRLTAGTSSMDVEFPALSELHNFAEMLGRRLGEMHVLLAKPSVTTRFGCAKPDANNAADWVDAIRQRMQRLLHSLHDVSSPQATEVVAKAAHINELIDRLAENYRALPGIRIHGNLTLAHVLVVRQDAYFINFSDGIITGTTSDNSKNDCQQNPLKDVANLLSSFDDAAMTAIRTASTMSAPAEQGKITTIITAANSQMRTLFYSAYCTAAVELMDANQTREQEEAMLRLHAMDNKACEILNHLNSPEARDTALQNLLKLINY
ncbi:MAG TPA: maltose alpha-D-glucosyltransferase [Cellvibrionaceae bacterium]